MRQDRLPPGQGLIRDPDNWPIVGERAPRESDLPWEIAVSGRVAHSRIWSLEHLQTWPQQELTLDIHCVTRWSKLGRRFRGVPLRALLDRSVVGGDGRFVRFVARSEREHDTSLPIEVAMDCLIAFEAEGRALAAEHGGPVRVITPGRYFYKSLKWLERVEVLADNWLGYWESGPRYHDEADPWRELRYVTGNISPDLRARMIQRRSLGRRDLMGVDFSGEALEGLDAAGATLRNVAFRGADLRGADFSGANLSNADLTRANLRDARFMDADLEGAAFDAADLRGADFTGASLFGASFSGPPGGAVFDGATRLTVAQAQRLADSQAAYVLESLNAAQTAA